MARDVQHALEDIFMECEGCSPAQASEHFRKMRKQRRYQLDVW